MCCLRALTADCYVSRRQREPSDLVCTLCVTSIQRTWFSQVEEKDRIPALPGWWGDRVYQRRHSSMTALHHKPNRNYYSWYQWGHLPPSHPAWLAWCRRRRLWWHLRRWHTALAEAALFHFRFGPVRYERLRWSLTYCMCIGRHSRGEDDFSLRHTISSPSHTNWRGTNVVLKSDSSQILPPIPGLNLCLFICLFVYLASKHPQANEPSYGWSQAQHIHAHIPI